MSTTLYFILAGFRDGKQLYIDRDPAEADLETTIRDLMSMQVDRPLSVLAVDRDEGWCADVSEDIAREIAKRADGPLQPALIDFIESHTSTRLVNELEAA